METRGGFLIRGLWESQTDAIIDVRFGDANADTYKYEPMDNLLARCMDPVPNAYEVIFKEKKRKEKKRKERG